MKYQQKGKQRAAVGGLVGVSVMAGVWKMAALRRGVGIAGVLGESLEFEVYYAGGRANVTSELLECSWWCGRRWDLDAK